MRTWLCSRGMCASQPLGLQGSESGFDPVKPLQWQRAPTWRMALLIFTKYFLTHPQAQTPPSGWEREEKIIYFSEPSEKFLDIAFSRLFSVSWQCSSVLDTFLQRNFLFFCLKNKSFKMWICAQCRGRLVKCATRDKHWRKKDLTPNLTPGK